MVESRSKAKPVQCRGDLIVRVPARHLSDQLDRLDFSCAIVMSRLVFANA
jgi:hypothetical protein